MLALSQPAEVAVARSLHLCRGQKPPTVSAGWLLGEPDTEQAVAAMTHAVHLGHWQAPLRLAEWHHRGAQGLEVSRPSVDVSWSCTGEQAIPQVSRPSLHRSSGVMEGC